MGDSMLIVRFPDGRTQFGLFQNTADVAHDLLYDRWEDVGKGAGQGKPGPTEALPVEIWTSYGDGFWWHGSAVPGRLVTGHSFLGDEWGQGIIRVTDGTPQWAEDARRSTVRSRRLVPGGGYLLGETPRFQTATPPPPKPLTIAELQQIIEEFEAAKPLVFASADIIARLEAEGLGGSYRFQVSDLVPAGQMIVIDENAANDAWKKALDDGHDAWLADRSWLTDPTDATWNGSRSSLMTINDPIRTIFTSSLSAETARWFAPAVYNTGSPLKEAQVRASFNGAYRRLGLDRSGYRRRTRGRRG